MADTFTPEQIAQILEEFFNTVGTRQYIGPRIVPLFGRKNEDTIEWDNEGAYEPLTVVLYQGNSYTSRQYVPVGVEITNQQFWALTGNFNAQVEQYRRDTAAAAAAAANAQSDIDTLLPKTAFTPERTINDVIQEIKNDLDSVNDDLHKAIVFTTPEMYGAVGDGVSDDTNAVQQALNNGSFVVCNKTYMISTSISLADFTGYVMGSGKLKAKPNTSIPILVNMHDSENVLWTIDIDMSQTQDTMPEDARCEIGIYIRNARNIVLDNVTYSNCRIGRPFSVSGSSSIAPSDTEGSKYIYVENNKIFGFTYDTVDEGCYPVISSDFYTSDGDGIFFAASNALRKSDMQFDTNFAYKRTTEHVFVDNLYAENCDRIAILNASDVHFTNCQLVNFFTRGYNFSPSVNNFSVVGGSVNGGEATQLACALGCSSGTFDNIQLSINGVALGEKTAIKAYYGCHDIMFSNIIGESGIDRGCYFVASKNITVKNVNLKPHGNTATVSVDVRSGLIDTTSYVSDNILFDGCIMESTSFFMRLQDAVGESYFALNAVRIVNCSIRSGNVFTSDSSYSDSKGILSLSDCKCEITSGNPQYLDSKLICRFVNNIGLLMNMVSQIDVETVSVYQSFDVYYYVPKFFTVAGNDAYRCPPINIYKNGIALIYGKDWFCDSTLANEVMANRVRFYTPYPYAVGDKLTLERRM